jgi:hypothetical protein
MEASQCSCCGVSSSQCTRRVSVLRHVNGLMDSWCEMLGSDAYDALSGVDLSVVKKSALIVVDMQNDFIPIESDHVYTVEECKFHKWDVSKLEELNERILKGSKRSAFASPVFGSYKEKEKDRYDNIMVISKIQRLLSVRAEDLFIFSMDEHPLDSISFALNRGFWAEKLTGE